MNDALKRLMDILFSAIALIILSPLFLLLCYLVRKHLGKSIFFCQTRPGKNGRPFKMIKFRTMRDAVNENWELLSDDERLTAFGKKLRASSLDELPELWNVLKGDMSLVGPRPLLMQYLPLYNDFQRRRHEVKPGIIGWAQVNGRNAISWSQKFHYDVWYVDNHHLWLDIKILFLTIKKFLFAKESVPKGKVPCFFTGNNDNEE